MLRSIGAARGAVCVAAGAENVRPPRLPELPLDRASTEATVNASAATTASDASTGRRERIMVFPLKGAEARIIVPPVYWYARPSREGAVDGGRCIVPQVPVRLWPFE
jgi:hypothetical protein